MKLSAADINQIRVFISKRGFTEPDLQMEIIDHIACRVEEMLTANPEISLGQAVHTAHAEFGIMGFSVFEDAMKANLQKRYFKIFKQLWLGSFNYKTLPVMIAFIYLVSIGFKAIAEPQIVFNATGFILLTGLVINGLLNSARYKRYKKMLTFKMGSMYLVLSCALFQLYNLFIIQLQLYKYVNPNWLGTPFAIMLTILLVTIYAINQTQRQAVNSCKFMEERYFIS